VKKSLESEEGLMTNQEPPQDIEKKNSILSLNSHPDELDGEEMQKVKLSYKHLICY